MKREPLTKEQLIEKLTAIRTSMEADNWKEAKKLFKLLRQSDFPKNLEFPMCNGLSGDVDALFFYVDHDLSDHDDNNDYAHGYILDVLRGLGVEISDEEYMLKTISDAEAEYLGQLLVSRLKALRLARIGINIDKQAKEDLAAECRMLENILTKIDYPFRS